MSFETGGYVHYLFKFTDKRILMVSSPFHEFIIVWEIKRVKKQSNMRFASVLISNGREKNEGGCAFRTHDCQKQTSYDPSLL